MTIAGADINIYRAVIIVIALIMTAITWFIMYRTSIGHAGPRDHAQSEDGRGVRHRRRPRRCADPLAYGSGLAGTTRRADVRFQTVFPDMGTPLVVDGFLVVVVGGVGGLFGSLAA